MDRPIGHSANIVGARVKRGVFEPQTKSFEELIARHRNHAHEQEQPVQNRNRNLLQQVNETSDGQWPFAVVLSCIDSRTSAELIFDQGLGDIFSVRVAGNIAGPMVLGSVEYACVVAGAKLVLVLGHTRCGAVTSTVELRSTGADPDQVAGCENLGHIVRAIDQAIAKEALRPLVEMATAEREAFVDDVAKRNVLNVVESLSIKSEALRRLSDKHRISIVAGMYNVVDREIEFLDAASRVDASES